MSLLRNAVFEVSSIKEFNVEERIKAGGMVGNFKIDFVSSNFRENFYGIVERDLPEANIQSWVNVHRLKDPWAIHIIGGKERALFHIARIFQIIELGESGPGVFNRNSNLQYVTSNKDGSLWLPGWVFYNGKIIFSASKAFSESWWERGMHFYTYV